ncbi:unnamed protein product [Allacma fusca]|uniref:Uncharacterized protein n=1 Tax=Allacma fusca TaxID=39272 RepID=A0A8J2JXT8_9HEXA|nr:unnamed protein product [Allacma fusca]
MRHFPVHLVWGLGCGMECWWLYFQFFSERDLNVKIVEEIYIFRGEISKGFSSLKQYPIEKIVLLSLPTLPLTCIAGYILLAYSDPTRKHLLFSVLPETYKSTLTFWILISLETYISGMSFALLTYDTFVQLATFIHVNSLIASEVRALKKGNRIFGYNHFDIEESCRLCRHLQLLIHYFNHCFSNVVFVLKLYCLSVSTVCLYFAVKLLHVFPMDSIVNAGFGSIIVIEFVVMYDKAFRIPDGIMEFKKEIERKSSEITTSWKEKLILKKKLAAIPNLGVKVGSFQLLERTSTLIFIDFIASKTATLLIMH